MKKSAGNRMTQMKLVTKIIIDISKLDEVQKKLEAIVSTIESSAPETNKNRRIRSLVSMAKNLITDLITIDHSEGGNHEKTE